MLEVPTHQVADSIHNRNRSVIRIRCVFFWKDTSLDVFLGQAVRFLTEYQNVKTVHQFFHLRTLLGIWRVSDF